MTIEKTQLPPDCARLQYDDILQWLRLAHSPGISPGSAQRLLQLFRSPAAIFAASPARLKKSGVQQRLITAIESHASHLDSLHETTMRWLQIRGHSIITCVDPRFPAPLKSIPAPPVLLYVDGDPDILATPGVAFVGSRKATPPARNLTHRLSGELATLGLTIISGLAAGIDGAAHEGALDRQGLTLAVTGNGLDRVYPRCHQALASAISANGAIISEFPLGSPPVGHHFPRRNRIISGLSLGLVVVEAALRSGSLSSARHALEQGREVMAVPGSVNNPLSRGCHALLKSGATLVENADDIVAEIAAQIDMDTQLASGSPLHEPAPDTVADPQAMRLLASMGYEPISVDRLVDDSGMPAKQVLTTLLQMELAGRVTVDSAGRYTRCKA